MKFRKDYVSNSSSCSFIIHVESQADKDELRKNEETLKQYAREVSHKFNDIPYGDCTYFDSVDNLEIGDFVRIYIGEDNEYNWDVEDPGMKLADIAWELNKDYKKLKFYGENDAHVTLGEDYKENKK